MRHAGGVSLALAIVLLGGAEARAQDPRRSPAFDGELGVVTDATPGAAPEHVVTTRDGLRGGLSAPVRTLPRDGTSALFRSLYFDATVLADRGTVPSNLVLTTGNVASPEIAVDPPQIWARTAKLIENARHDVALQTFAWDVHSDAVGAVFDALVRLQERRRAEAPGAPPVVVRILIDAMDVGANGNKPTLALMASAARKVQDAGLDPAVVRVELAAHHHSLLGSLHSKSLVVDGVRAIVTGSNMGPDDAFVTGQHDAAFVLEGEVARALLADFDDAWLASQVWVGGTTLPSPERDRRWDARPRRLFERPDRIEHVVLPLPAASSPVPMLTLGKRPVEGLGGNGYARSTLTRAVISGFRNARTVVRLQTPNLNDDEVKREILAAVRRGVRVEVLYSKNYEWLPESVPGQGGTNADVAGELLAALAAEPEARNRLSIREYVNPGETRPVDGHETRANHVKLASFDDQVVLVGSLNMDTQSFNHSREIGVLIDSAEVTKTWLDALYRKDFARAHPVEGTASSVGLTGVVEASGPGH